MWLISLYMLKPMTAYYRIYKGIKTIWKDKIEAYFAYLKCMVSGITLLSHHGQKIPFKFLCNEYDKQLGSFIIQNKTPDFLIQYLINQRLITLRSRINFYP